MTAKADVTAEYLREILIYNPLIGIFTNRIKRWSAMPGQIVGSINLLGYIAIGINDRVWLAHRLAFLYMTSEWPKNSVDHINGIRNDNRWKNLRDVTQFVNLQNQKRAKRGSRSGLLGVTINNKNVQSWQAKITVHKKVIYLGTYPTKEEAHAVYIAAKRKLHEGNTL